MAGLVGFKPASEEVSKINREEDIKTIQRALGSKIVQEKLKAYGLSKEVPPPSAVFLPTITYT